jgi:hypothetical protein
MINNNKNVSVQYIIFISDVYNEQVQACGNRYYFFSHIGNLSLNS